VSFLEIFKTKSIVTKTEIGSDNHVGCNFHLNNLAWDKIASGLEKLDSVGNDFLADSLMAGCVLHEDEICSFEENPDEAVAVSKYSVEADCLRFAVVVGNLNLVEEKSQQTAAG